MSRLLPQRVLVWGFRVPSLIFRASPPACSSILSTWCSLSCSTQHPGSRGEPLLESVVLFCFYCCPLYKLHINTTGGYVCWSCFCFVAQLPYCVCMALWPWHYIEVVPRPRVLEVFQNAFMSQAKWIPKQKAAVSDSGLFFCQAGGWLVVELTAKGTPIY